SLMYQEVWTRVVRGHYQCRPATLPGYRRRAVRGEVYPVALRALPENRIDGMVYIDVDPDDIDRLDIFEGKYYRRRIEEVSISSGTTIKAGVFVLRPDYHHIAADDDWDAEQFQRTGLPRFLGSYLGFGAVGSDR
ncbi:MAG: gamma-glutamylcyclotransferase, partial [Desulfofustis sp.]|nr:gamma-glutamylcyclotransferase [Desulfofustis sp.]